MTTATATVSIAAQRAAITRHVLDLEQQRPRLAYAASLGEAGAELDLDAVEQQLVAARGSLERLALASAEAARVETEQAAQAEAARKETLRSEHAQHLAERERCYASIEHCTTALLEAVHEALAAAGQADAVTGQLGRAYGPPTIRLQAAADVAAYVLTRLDGELRPHVFVSGRPLNRLTHEEK